jgi:hypothetical protein
MNLKNRTRRYCPILNNIELWKHRKKHRGFYVIPMFSIVPMWFKFQTDTQPAGLFNTM